MPYQFPAETATHRTSRCQLLPINLRREIRNRMAIFDPEPLARELAVLKSRQWPVLGAQEMQFVGIDGGVTGAMASVDRQNRWLAQHALVGRYQDLNVLDERNLLLLRSLAEQAGGVDRMIVAYESGRKNASWGIQSTFTGGKHHEFWRVLLSAHGFQFVGVDPLTWQAYCKLTIKDAKGKLRAPEFVRHHCPDTDWLDAYSATDRAGIVDAMCIALWARHQHQTGQL